ncbi:hypothetical protein V6N13_116259 [Hibiscus sabdariffa]
MWIFEQNLMKFYVKRRVFGCRNLVFSGSNLGLGVHALRDSNGAWCSDQSHLRSMVVDYYKYLFSSIGSTASGYLHHGYFMQCNAEMRRVFTAPILDEEISKTVFEMGPLRAPGVDGFNDLFYQRNWSIVGPSVCALVRDTFNGHPFNASLNRTLLVLLPKNIGDGWLVDFWQDAWLSDVSSLAGVVLDPTVVASLPCVTVAEMVDATRVWKWQEFAAILPTPILHRLTTTVPPRRIQIEDAIGWRCSTT